MSFYKSLKPTGDELIEAELFPSSSGPEAMECDNHARLVELDADDVAVLDRTTAYFQRLIDEMKSIRAGDDPLLAAVRKFDKTCSCRVSSVAALYSWCNSARSTRLQRVIRTQPTASGRRKCNYKGGRSLTVSGVRAHKLAQVVRANVAPAKKH